MLVDFLRKADLDLRDRRGWSVDPRIVDLAFRQETILRGLKGRRARYTCELPCEDDDPWRIRRRTLDLARRNGAKVSVGERGSVAVLAFPDVEIVVKRFYEGHPDAVDVSDPTIGERVDEAVLAQASIGDARIVGGAKTLMRARTLLDRIARWMPATPDPSYRHGGSNRPLSTRLGRVAVDGDRVDEIGFDTDDGVSAASFHCRGWTIALEQDSVAPWVVEAIQLVEATHQIFDRPNSAFHSAPCNVTSSATLASVMRTVRKLETSALLCDLMDLGAPIDGAIAQERDAVIRG